MARDKTDKTDESPPATLATTATREAEAKSREAVGLLGGELDAFAALGLGLGASDRAKELILRGLLAELERLARMDAQRKPGRGRPRKDFPNIDIERAAAVLGADDFLRERFGRGAETQKEAIELAMQFDQLLYERGARDRHIFSGTMTTFKRLQDSVSLGLRELGEAGERFLKKAPDFNKNESPDTLGHLRTIRNRKG